jgi:cell division protein FtsN
MNKLTGLFFIIIVTLACSCSGTNKLLKRSKKSGSNTLAVTKTGNLSETPVKEVEERLVRMGDNEPDFFSYYVIIGSFRNPDNARKHQVQIRQDGFNSDIVRNEAGLYRVSVLSTENIAEARAEIRRIRANYPIYSDTWLLVRKN